MERDAKIYIAGSNGLIGSKMVKYLQKQGYNNLITISHRELDLTRQSEVENFFKQQQPLYVILLAAKVGGIYANMSYPAEFIYKNLAIQTNVIHSAYLNGVKKLLFFASACSYPRDCAQPMREEYLLSGCLEPTNESYAVAKIAGIKMIQAYNRQYGTNFISAVVTNVYGPGDNFDLVTSHVIPALIRKFHEAKINSKGSVTIWGSGNPRREFIYVDDVADGAIFLMNNYDKSDIINLCVGNDVTIKELASIVKDVVGYEGKIVFDASKSDGIPRKMLDPSKLKNMGWQAKTPLREGIAKMYSWYKIHLEEVMV